MPGIFLTLSGVRNAEVTQKCVIVVTHLTSDILKKNSYETMVIIRYVSEDDWFIDGRSLTDWGKRSFRLEVTLVDETCTKDQKAEYQRILFNKLSDIIGNVHPHTNIHVMDCKAASYGYNGITQEYRYQHKEEFYKSKS